MKVLFLSHSSAVENLGGAELSLLHLIDEWRRRDPGVEFSVVAREPAGLLQPELSRRLVAHRTVPFDSWVLPQTRTIPHHVVDIAEVNSDAVAFLIRVLTEERPDVVVTNTIVSPWAALAAKYLGIPHVWFVHEYGDLDHGLNFELGRDATWEDIGGLSDLVITNSLAVRRHVDRWMPGSKVMVAYPVIDLEHARSLALSGAVAVAAVAERSPSDPLRVVTVGRLAESKGQWRLLRAVARLRDRGVHIVVELVGRDEGEEADAVKALVVELGLGSQVTLTGETENPFAFMARADVGVTASDSEAFGRVTVEYMALGKPVVATGTGASAELVTHGVTGFLVDRDAPEELVAALERYAADRALVRTHGAAALDAVGPIAEAFPIGLAIDRIQALVDHGPEPMNRLPHAMRLWLDLPAYVDLLDVEWGARNAAVLQSRSWRWGSTVVTTVGALQRARRRIPHRRPRA